MNVGVVGSYNAVDHILRLDATLGKISNIAELQKGTSLPDNPLSTIIHELLHSSTADTYREKVDEITKATYGKYIEWAYRIAKESIDKLGSTGYNIKNISEYAVKRINQDDFDEAYTEYLVKKLLGGK